MRTEAAIHFQEEGAGNGTNGTMSKPMIAPASMTRPNDARRSVSDLMRAFHVACISAAHSTSAVTTGVRAMMISSGEMAGRVTSGRDLAQDGLLVAAARLRPRTAP